MYGQNIRTRLDIMKRDLTTTVTKRQYVTKAKHCVSVIREFSSGDAFNTRDYQANSEKWVNGFIHSHTGPLSYKVDVDGTLWRRHVYQIMGTSENQPSHPTGTVTSDVPVTYFIPLVPSSRVSDAVSETKSPVPSVTEPRRNPPRNRKKPNRLNQYYVMSAVKNGIQLDEQMFKCFECYNVIYFV